LQKAGISLGLFLIFSCAANAEKALRTPPLLDTKFVACSSGLAPHTRNVRLFARESMRHDVGPYSVLLPGYSTNKTDSGHDSYAPLRIEACRGDTLQIALVNQLPAAYYQPDTNLHTHGLIVTPTPDKPGPAGDYIFLQVSPGETENYRIPIPSDLPGAMFGKSTQKQPYPSGLYWFHAHRHMFARGQVQGGGHGRAGGTNANRGYRSRLREEPR
jgi:Multicopper oxidase